VEQISIVIPQINEVIYGYLRKIHLSLGRRYKIATGVIQTYVGETP